MGAIESHSGSFEAIPVAIAKGSRVILYSETGRQHICDTLLPKNLNRGHWFNKPEELISLMQQFAINTTFEVLKERGLFSVNGPPGTGKTTLLREIFAENIVRRAARLASLNSAGDAFSPKKVRVCFGDGFSSSIAKFEPDIAGFEMVDASSNNTAVENISRDLPKRSSLKEPWLSSRYIQSVAHKIAAQKENGSCKKLPEDEVRGGLSPRAGQEHNRRWFKERFHSLKLNQMKNRPGAVIQSLKTFGNGRAISRVPLSLMQLVIFETREQTWKRP